MQANRIESASAESRSPRVEACTFCAAGFLLGRCPMSRLRASLNVDQNWRAGDEMCEVYNAIGGNAASDHWFDEHIASLRRPLENSFSPRQRFDPDDKRVRFDVHLWATLDGGRCAYPQVAAQLRKMARFLEQQAGLVDKLTGNRKAVKP